MLAFISPSFADPCFFTFSGLNFKVRGTMRSISSLWRFSPSNFSLARFCLTIAAGQSCELPLPFTFHRRFAGPAFFLSLTALRAVSSILPAIGEKPPSCRQNPYGRNGANPACSYNVFHYSPPLRRPLPFLSMRKIPKTLKNKPLFVLAPSLLLRKISRLHPVNNVQESTALQLTVNSKTELQEVESSRKYRLARCRIVSSFAITQ